MIDLRTKEMLKKYLNSCSHITGDWEFSKTEHFCKIYGIEFKEMMEEIQYWQTNYGNGTELSDNSLPYAL